MQTYRKIEYVKNEPNFLRKMQTLQVFNSRFISIKTAKFSGYDF